MPNDRRLLVKGRDGFDSTDTDKNFSQKQAFQLCTPLPITSSREVLITNSFACCEMHQVTAVFGVLSDARFQYVVSCEARKLFRILHLSELV